MALQPISLAIRSSPQPWTTFSYLPDDDQLATSEHNLLPASGNTAPIRYDFAVYDEILRVPANPPTPQDWESYRPLFTKLYREENRPWKEVQVILERGYGFKARYAGH